MRKSKGESQESKTRVRQGPCEQNWRVRANKIGGSVRTKLDSNKTRVGQSEYLRYAVSE